MPEPPIQISQPRRSPSLVGGVSAIRNWVQCISPKARLPVFAGLVILIGLAIYTSLVGGPATLNLVCRYNLRSVNLSVAIDGKPSYQNQFSGSSLKRFGIFGKPLGGTFSKALTVSAGEHVIDVHLTSAADGFDQIKRCELTLPARRDTTLLIVAQRGGMSLVPSIAPTNDVSFKVSDSLRSILITGIGAAVSAGIGFFVQEFLRSKRAA